MNPTNGRTRWIICALLFFSVAVNYIDRLVIGIAYVLVNGELIAEYGELTQARSGVVLRAGRDTTTPDMR